jgi:hypothetical protein
MLNLSIKLKGYLITLNKVLRTIESEMGVLGPAAGTYQGGVVDGIIGRQGGRSGSNTR